METWESRYIAPYFSKEGGSPKIYSAFNILSNFHANAKYVKYAHNRGITTVKLHKKGRNRLKNARRSAARAVQINRSRTVQHDVFTVSVAPMWS